MAGRLGSPPAVFLPVCHAAHPTCCVCSRSAPGQPSRQTRARQLEEKTARNPGCFSIGFLKAPVVRRLELQLCCGPPTAAPHAPILAPPCAIAAATPPHCCLQAPPAAACESTLDSASPGPAARCPLQPAATTTSTAARATCPSATPSPDAAWPSRSYLACRIGSAVSYSMWLRFRFNPRDLLVCDTIAGRWVKP
jgi:hypothetical protein